MVGGLLRIGALDQLPPHIWVENRRSIHSCVTCFGQVDRAEPIPVQVKPQRMSSNLKARLDCWLCREKCPIWSLTLVCQTVHSAMPCHYRTEDMHTSEVDRKLKAENIKFIFRFFALGQHRQYWKMVNIILFLFCFNVSDNTICSLFLKYSFLKFKTNLKILIVF